MDLCKVNTVKELRRILAVLSIADLMVTNQYHLTETNCLRNRRYERNQLRAVSLMPKRFASLDTKIV